MNAPHLTRREVTGALAGILLSFNLGARPAPAQPSASLPGSLAGNPMLDA
jgi:hypothetical protein